MPANTHAFRLMLDSSVIFALDDEEPGLLEDLVAVAGQIDLFVTHVQYDEDRRGSRALQRLPVRQVATSHFVLGHSRLGMAQLGPPQTFEPLTEGNPNHTEDALISASALEHDAILVIRDKKAVSRLRRSGTPVRVWDLEDLRARVAELLCPDGS